ncbi:hypothetical protein C7S15_1150 [Burkholderia cepacia]|nr:hypothetical protein [Burkholderia cepacia]
MRDRQPIKGPCHRGTRSQYPEHRRDRQRCTRQFQILSHLCFSPSRLAQR